MTPTPQDGEAQGPSAGLRIALIGSRGVPANYGGYETFMEELSTRLVGAGHRVTVYCRSHHTPRSTRHHRGVELVVLPTIRTKHLDTPVHTLLASLHVALRQLQRRGFDAALMVNGANALFVPLLRAVGVPTALHVDGIERRRAKWGALGRAVYALSERLACIVPDALITDADVIERHYLDLYDAPSTVIAYGVEPDPLPPGEWHRRLGLEPARYFLYVSRFEPENNPHRVAQAYRAVGGELPLVMVGGAPYANDFIESFTRDADPRIRFPGAIYGEGYRELLSSALAYIHATEVGGTHPALVEAMGYGNCPVVNDTPENREVAGDHALYFDAEQPETLAAQLERLRLDPAAARGPAESARARAQQLFSWPAVCSRYEALFVSLSRGSRRA